MYVISNFEVLRISGEIITIAQKCGLTDSMEAANGGGYIVVDIFLFKMYSGRRRGKMWEFFLCLRGPLGPPDFNDLCFSYGSAFFDHLD